LVDADLLESDNPYDDLSELEQLVRDWRATADELADQARR
jgi:hypothetical protein